MDRRGRRDLVRRLVRACAPHRGNERAVFHGPVCQHALVDPHAGPLRALEWLDDPFYRWSERADAPDADAIEPLWRQYYANIFNRARQAPRDAGRDAQRYWKNLPEAELIPALIRQAPVRVETMLARSEAQHPPDAAWQPAQPPLTDDLGILREAAAGCVSCPLYKNAMRTVFGEGSFESGIVFVGEQAR